MTRYHNGRILVFAAIAKMVDYKPIDGSSRQLRALQDKIKNSVSTLKNLEICTKCFYPLSPSLSSIRQAVALHH